MLKRILGLLGWLGVALVFAAVAARFLPSPTLQPYANKLAIAGLVCTLLYILSQWREIGQAFAGRQARFGTLALVSAAVVLGILVAINVLSTRHNKRWDLTAAKQFELSDQTKKVLHDLKSPVKVLVFARTDEFPRYRDHLDEYQYQSKQLQPEYVDPEKKPAVATKYDIHQPTVIFEYNGRTEKATGEGEQELTNALIKVVQGRTPKVYFTDGHGEKNTSGSDRAGYSSINSALTSSNFVVDKLVLAQQSSVPADADIVIVAGPKMDFLAPEMDMLKAYLAKGGKLFVMLDPVLKPDAPQLTNLQALLKDWDIEAGNDIVLDVSGTGRLALGTDESVPLAASYPAHPITDNFRYITAYPLARSMTPIEGGVNGRNAQKLVETSRNSWAETNLKDLANGKPAKQDDADKAGPVSLAAAISVATPAAPAPKPGANGENPPKTPETRVVAFGDSDFASNGAINVQGNRDLFLNAVNWLAQQENLIAIRPRDPEDRRITLTADQMRRIFYLTVLIVPGLILLAGVQTWWRRR
jgi:gliding motility-associatede transport system auxiliary component